MPRLPLALAECVRFGLVCHLVCPLLFACCGLMPRRGWTTKEVPDGWVQLIRGPRPKSEKWLLQSRQKPTPAVRQSGVQGTQGPVIGRPATDPVRCVSPYLARVTAQERARKLEKALEVMSDVEGPALRVELKKAQNAAAVPPLDGQIQQCESFISRSERPVGRDRRTKTCRGRVVDESQGEVGAVAVGNDRRTLMGNRGQEDQTASCRVAMPSPSVSPCAIFCRGSPDGPGTSGQAKSLCRGSAFNGASTRRVVVREASGTLECSGDWGSISVVEQ